jgi:hypothetical protein
MKKLKIILFLLCICITNGYTQNNVLYNGIQQAKSFGEKFESFSAFTLVNKNTSQSERIQDNFINPQDVHILQYDKSATKNLATSMTLIIPAGDKNLQLELQEISMDYQIRTSCGQLLPANKNIKHYRGIVKDDPNSLVALTFGENEIMGLVATNEGNFNLVFDQQLGKHVFYNDKNMKHKPTFDCETDTEDYSNADSKNLLQNSKSSICSFGRIVRLYFETTYDFLDTLGSVSGVELFVSCLYNQVATLYQNEHIITVLSEIFIWTSPDPFATAPSLGNMLTRFRIERNSFNGDIGQLLTVKNFGGGGVAYLNTLCDDNKGYRLSVSQIRYHVYQQLPNYSGPVYVVTHEFGHILGSPHTHDCAWNGNNTAIDGCDTIWDNRANGIVRCPPIPAMPPEGGTIMSYCHVQPVGIVFSNGFGPQPGDLIRNRVSNATCLQTLTIFGPDILANLNLYQIQHLLPGAQVTWAVGPGISKGTTLANGIYLSRIPNACADSWVEATIHCGSYSPLILRKTILVREPDFNYTNTTVINNTTITRCGNINVQNVTVTGNNAKLKLVTPGEVTISGPFEVTLGAQLEIK